MYHLVAADVENVARAALINEYDLISALETSDICAAGVDVLQSEQSNLHNPPLLDRGNVIVAPHVGFIPMLQYWKTVDFRQTTLNILSKAITIKWLTI